ncbi:ATP-dependent DNA ligase [Terriglobus tenax]|uniref:ATP-dependent DNA ligase n=1 Tax=Terriglobus tenax TaxID=1111115 RepID=UPI0021DFF941|nr:ATP-dependent DNA ligase [Terriglobus tenax]
MAQFSQLATLAEELAGTASRLKKRAAISAALAQVQQQGTGEAGLFAQYLAGLPFAEADSRKLNAGGAMLSGLVKEVSGATDAELSAAYRRHGDLGAAAAELLQGTGNNRAQGSAGIGLREVEEAFAASATAKSTAARRQVLRDLLRKAAPLEAKYLLKLMLGDMRIGVKQALVEEAIAEAAGAAVPAVRNAVMLEADLAGAVARAFAGTLHEARMRLFHPLGFMLASPVESPEEAVERFASTKEAAEAADVALEEKEPKREADPSAALRDDNQKDESVPPELLHIEALVEDKYDGMRAQVHCGVEGRVAIYSRNREEITESYPELVEAFDNVPEPLILDGEILGWDLAAQRALPFAVLGTRIGRKKVTDVMRAQVPVVFMAFDLMFAAGELKLDLPLRSRRNQLEAVAERISGITRSPIEKSAGSLFAGEDPPVERLILSPSFVVESADDIDRVYREARERGNEGVMLKAMDSTYQPGRRGLLWMKLKRELATLDVVVTGCEFGHGKRAGLLSDYTFAVRGPGGELLNVGKAYSGLTDVEIGELTQWMKDHTLEDFGHFRTVEPLTVFEVAFNNIMRSERHASGFALRFPRIVRIRTDKPVEEIDTLERVEAIYQSQPDKAGA